MLTLKRCREPGHWPCLARPGVSEEMDAPGATCSVKLQLFLPCGPYATPVMPIRPPVLPRRASGHRLMLLHCIQSISSALPCRALCHSSPRAFQLLRKPFAEPDTQLHDQGRGALQLDGSLFCFFRNTGTFFMVRSFGSRLMEA